jgi:hypothetical protein
VDLGLNADQKNVLDAVRVLFGRGAGPARMRELDGAMDSRLTESLSASGYLEIADEGGPENYLTATLVTEEASRSLASAPVGARALVCAYLGIENAPPTVGLADGNGAIVRYGADVELVLMVDGDALRVLEPNDLKVEPVSSRGTYPLARVTALPGRGRSLEEPDAVARMTRASRRSKWPARTSRCGLSSADTSDRFKPCSTPWRTPTSPLKPRCGWPARPPGTSMRICRPRWPQLTRPRTRMMCSMPSTKWWVLLASRPSSTSISGA